MIKGEKSEEKEEEKRSERRYGSFSRSFRVPDSADAEKIDANFKSGILKITFPKTADAQKSEKTISIKQARTV